MTAVPRTDTGPLLIVPAWLLEVPGIGARELQVHLVLVRHADNETGEAWPSRRRIAERCGVASVRTVDAARDRLVAVYAIRIRGRRDESDDWTTSVDPLTRAHRSLSRPHPPYARRLLTSPTAVSVTTTTSSRTHMHLDARPVLSSLREARC